MPCQVCHSSDVQPHASKNDIRFVKCHDCGYVVADPMPSQSELDELYALEHFQSSYHPEESENTELFEQRQVQYVQDREMLLEFLDSGRLLDFGCGNGHFLSGFPDSFEKYGYEFNRATTAYLGEHADFEVLETLEDLHALEDASFDGIMMRGVIEHLIDPQEILALLAAKLRPGGVLFICATPNIDSPCALVYGTDWNQFTPPYHLHFFSPRTLGLAGARHGLALVDCRFPYLGTPYECEASDGARFLQAASVGSPTGAVATAVSSPPYPGTMMSLVLRRIG